MITRLLISIFLFLTSPCLAWKSGKIVGGREARSGELPFLALILHNDEPYCGGAILTSQSIVTAAHCLLYPDTKNLRVAVGLQNLADLGLHADRFEAPQVLKIRKIIPHPGFKISKIDDDIAVIRIWPEIKFTESVKSIRLSEEGESFQGTMATIGGWGQLSEGGRKSPSLQTTHVPVMSNEECTELFAESGYDLPITERHLCAGFLRGGHDACTGDSGGPLAVQRDEEWFLIGIVSAGIGCARHNHPGLYTRVTSFRQWILQNQ